MQYISAACTALVLLSFFASCTAHAQVTYFGPTPYLQRSNTPVIFIVPQLVLEDFEDGLIDPRLAINATATNPGGFTDSVDADDGVINGSGTSGRSAFSFNPIRIEFASQPTAAGLV